MRNHELMARREQWQKGGNGSPHIGALGLGCHRLTPAQQGIATECYDDPHRSGPKGCDE